jgi:N5-(cytidine 5'-diphosphoramidyl)-L-glutamine hydrolase
MKNILITKNLKHDLNRNELLETIDINYIKFIQSINFNPFPVSSFIKDIEKNLKNMKPNGILLTGGCDIGKFDQRDLFEIKLIKFGIKKKIPIVGICRGMQIINLFFNGENKKVKNHISQINQIIELKTGKKRYVKCFHNFSISKKKLSKEFEIKHISAKDSEIESIYNHKKKIFGLMWHPEREVKFKKEDKNLIKFYLS